VAKRQFMINDPNILTTYQAVGVFAPSIRILSNCVKREYSGCGIDHRFADPSIWCPGRISASDKAGAKRNAGAVKYALPASLIGHHLSPIV
jgi:hypothetical protein